MSKIAGLKGRSPEAYPVPKPSGLVKTSGEVNPSAVGPLTTGLTSLLSLAEPVEVLPGNRAIVTYSGVLTASGPVLVTVEVILDGATVWANQIEVTSATESGVPFSIVFETHALDETPDPHLIDIQATASVASTATVSAGGSAVIISTPT
jgi:hypothetical protein